MAVVNPTFTKVRGSAGGIDAVIIQWTLGDSDTATPVQLPSPADRTVQVEGTFGGATMVLQGSNDSTTGSDGNYHTLNDPLGAAISVAAAGAIKQVMEVTRWMKPSTSGGSGSSLTMTICARRTLR
jgi:hypothetical protein